jgi:hypothetical protein
MMMYAAALLGAAWTTLSGKRGPALASGESPV